MKFLMFMVLTYGAAYADFEVVTCDRGFFFKHNVVSGVLVIERSDDEDIQSLYPFLRHDDLDNVIYKSSFNWTGVPDSFINHDFFSTMYINAIKVDGVNAYEVVAYKRGKGKATATFQNCDY